VSSGREPDEQDEDEVWIRGDAGRLPRGIHNPVLRGTHIGEKVDEVRNLMRAMPVSREMGCVCCGRYPEVPVVRSARDQAKQAREGSVDF
jgi:hypothetical protein